MIYSRYTCFHRRRRRCRFFSLFCVWGVSRAFDAFSYAILFVCLSIFLIDYVLREYRSQVKNLFVIGLGVHAFAYKCFHTSRRL